MKAQVFRGVNQLSYEELPIPTLETDEVLVKIHVVGLCQSDIKKFVILSMNHRASLDMKQLG